MQSLEFRVLPCFTPHNRVLLSLSAHPAPNSYLSLMCLYELHGNELCAQISKYVPSTCSTFPLTHSSPYPSIHSLTHSTLDYFTLLHGAHNGLVVVVVVVISGFYGVGMRDANEWVKARVKIFCYPHTASMKQSQSQNQSQSQ